MTIPIPLQEALRDSITSGSFVDTKFWVFSKCRSNTGRVGCPKPLFVNGHVAKRVPRLDALLDGCKRKENLRTRFPANRKPYTSDYDYEDDSDLEEDDDYDDGYDVSDEEPSIPPRVATEKSENDSPELVAIESSDSKNKSSDIISISDLDSLFSESLDAKDELVTTHVGKVVVIEDVAFVTFQAFLRYLYTNEIEFAPWGSVERREARALEAYGIPELKELALGQIQKELPKCNIVEEVFSEYTSWYPELRKLEIKHLARMLSPSDSRSTLESLKKKIDCYTHGQLPHAKHVISALYELMESDESFEEIPLPMVTPPTEQTPSGDWVGLKKALTSSLTSGTFLDSQFYAVDSKSSTGLPKICPMYFCSVANDNFVSKLIACSSKLKPRKVPVRSADGYDSDIQDEWPDQERSMGLYPRFKCVREDPAPSDLPLDPALLLNCGAAKTWSAIFLYVYTGQVKFAAIGSQGTPPKEVQIGALSEDGAESPQDQKRFGALYPWIIAVEPCSPKSIYCLAKKAGLTRLSDAAFKDIESKLDEKNIIEELFSPFTADHEDVREMEHELFQSKLKPLVDRALISNIIEGSSSGKDPHHTATIGLILERSIQEHRKRMSDKIKNAPQPDFQSEPERGTGTPAAPIPQMQPFAHDTAPQSMSQSSSASVLASASAKTEISPDTPEPGEETEVVCLEGPLTNTGANPSHEHTVKLVCRHCGHIKPLSGVVHLKCTSKNRQHHLKQVHYCTRMTKAAVIHHSSS